MSDVKEILVLHTQSALNTLAGKEALDLALIFGAYEQKVTVVFYQAGVFQAIAHQNPEAAGQKDYLSSIKVLDIYDIDQVYACEESLQQFGIKDKALIEGVRSLPQSQILALKQAADHVYII